MVILTENNKNPKWIYFNDKHSNEKLRNSTSEDGRWYTNTVTSIETQLTAKAVKDLYESFISAYQNNKPLTFHLRGNLVSKFTIINSHHGKELFLNSYGNEIYTEYDHRLITNLSGNAINIYYPWDLIPVSLKDFLLGDKPK